ncbi:MAG: Ig-like domain-containing protein, partial [Nitrososphaerales archaeon]
GGPFSSGDGQFNTPIGITVDSSGFAYVVDSGNNRIQKFNSTNGAFITKWGFGGSTNGKFTGATFIATGSNGTVFVTDSGNTRIQKFNSTTGAFIAKWGGSGAGDGQFSSPAGVTVDPAGFVYVAERNNKRIQKFDNNGVFVTKWGSFELVDGQFNNPRSVAVDSSGNVYVADYDNDRIQKFDGNGTFITKWGSHGTIKGKFSHPKSVSVDFADNVYVTDFDNLRVQKFTADGDFLSTWNTFAESGESKKPLSVSIDKFGNAYVITNNPGSYPIQKFNSNGGYIKSWSVGFDGTQVNNPSSVAVDYSGNVYVADTDNNRVLKFTSDGVPINWNPTSENYHPISIAIDSSGNVYVGDDESDRILKFSGSGNFITKWGSYGSAPGQFITPIGIALDPSNNIFVDDLQNNRIQKFGSGKVLYNPNPDYVGNDNISYSIADPLGATNTGTVSLTVSDAPYITAIVADDPDSSDSVYSNGDTMTVKFSKATNTPFKGANNQLTKANLDALFSFSQNQNPASLGSDYTAKWLTPSTLIITIQDTTDSTPPEIGGLILTVKESANLKTALGTSLASTFASPPLSGSFGKFTVVVPVEDHVASAVLPSGTAAQVKLPPTISGSVNVTRSTLSDVGNNDTKFVGTIVDITPPEDSCSSKCEFSFILDKADLDNAGVTLSNLRIFHDKNHDGDASDPGETIIPTIQGKLPDGPFTVTVRDTASTFALGGTESAINIIQNVINDNGGNAIASDFTITITGGQFPLDPFAGSEVGTRFALDEDVSYTITGNGPEGYSFVSITGQDCPSALGESFQLSKGQSITCTITYDDLDTGGCQLPSSGDWTVISSCILQNDFNAPANVTVQNGAVLTIPSGVSLNIDLAQYHLLVKSGSGVLIKAGGKIF